MEILYWTLLIIGGFLLGGVMFSQWIPKRLTGKDICAISVDNNPGTFNAFKHCGKKIGTLCLVLDLLKGFLPVLLASLLLGAKSIAFSFVMLAPVLGHAVGVFNRFRGGKCIAASFGVMLGLLPVAWIPLVALAGLYVLFSTVLKIKNAGVRSIVVYALFILISCTVLGVLGQAFVAIGCGLVGILPIVKFLFSKNGLAENKFHDKTTEMSTDLPQQEADEAVNRI